MIVHRIGSNRFIDDLKGTGAFLHGGRWNRKGVYVLYTADSVALAAWEYFVHLDKTIPLLGTEYSRVSIDVPDLPFKSVTTLPPSWPKTSEDLLNITDEWLAEKDQLCMRVPSAVISDHHNYLVDPLHPAFVDVKIVDKEPFEFDSRAFANHIVPLVSNPVYRAYQSIVDIMQRLFL